VPASDAEALRWFKAAADQNLDAGQYDLGLLYAEGRGVAANPAEAAKWFRQAADQGFPSAQVELAESYERGRGETKDLLCAQFWYSLAAAQGDHGGGKQRDRLASQLSAEQQAEVRRMVAASEQSERPFIKRPFCPGERMSLKFAKSTVGDLVPIFERLTGLTFDLPQGAAAAPVKIDVEDVPWEEALAQALASAGYAWTREGTTARVRRNAPTAGAKRPG
jgi:TPR repeat protein